MTFKATLTRGTTDSVKSKIMSPKLTQITLDAYISPSEFARLMEDFFETSFDVELTIPDRELEFEKDVTV